MEIKVANEPKVNGYEVLVVIEAVKHADVSSLEARTLAITTAQSKLGPCGISKQIGPYPVDAEGVNDEAVTFGKRPTAAYRMDYTILGRP